MSFPENLQLKNQIKQIQEQNDQLRKILAKYGSIDQNFSMPNLPEMDKIPNLKGIDMIPNFGRNTVGIPNFGRNTVGVRRPRGIDMIPNFGRYVMESAEQNQNFNMFDKINSGEMDVDTVASWVFGKSPTDPLISVLPNIDETLRNHLNNQDHQSLQIGLDVLTHLSQKQNLLAFRSPFKEKMDLLLHPSMIQHFMKDPRRINHILYSGSSKPPIGRMRDIFESTATMMKKSPISSEARESYDALLSTITSHPNFEETIQNLDARSEYPDDDELKHVKYFDETKRIDIIDAALKTGNPETIRKITSGLDHTVKYPVETNPKFLRGDKLNKTILHYYQKTLTNVILNAAQSKHEAAVKYAIGHPIFHSIIMNMIAKDPKMIETLHPIAQDAVRLKGRPGKLISFKNKEPE